MTFYYRCNGCGHKGKATGDLRLKVCPKCNKQTKWSVSCGSAPDWWTAEDEANEQT